jgi:DNA primase
MSALTSLEQAFSEACAKVTGHEARRVGVEWKTLCPVHGDTTPSLDFHEENGKILVTCRSRGCSARSIFDAVNWEPRSPATRDTFAGRSVRARYAYTEKDGRELAVKVRFDDKGEPKCMFTKKLGGKKLPLYRLPDVLSAVRLHHAVHVTEGEHDADTLNALGLCGTSAPYGAVTGENVGGKWLPDYTDLLACADDDVVLFQDADEAGAEHVRNVARLLAGRVKSLRIVPPFPGGKGCDVSDFLAAHGREETLAFIATA